MTPQEQYPKFYSHPQRYLGIEVERMSNHAKYIIDYSFLNAAGINKDLHEFAPKFKPQQGEQFIKDLEDAVSCGFVADTIEDRMLIHVGYDESDSYYFTGTLGSVYINKASIGICRPMDIWGYAIEFDTAAYVDRMRELGYYL